MRQLLRLQSPIRIVLLKPQRLPPLTKTLYILKARLSGQSSRDQSEYVNAIGVISEHLPVNLHSE